MNVSTESISSSLVSIASHLSSAYPDNNTWVGLVRDGRYREALQLVEPEVEQHPTDSETKLWWLYCQLEAGDLPVSALAAPLDEIAGQVDEISAPSLRALACSTFLRAAVLLLQRKQPRLSVNMLARAVSFSSALPPGEQKKLLQTSQSLLTKEQNDAPLRRESGQYLEQLNNFSALVRESLSSLSVSASTPTSAPHASPEPTSSTLLNSKSIISAARDAAENAPPSNDWAKADSIEAGDTSKGLWLFASIAIVSVFLLAFFSWQFLVSPASVNNIAERLALQTHPLELPAPLSPEPEAPVSLTQEQSAKLDSVSSRLENLKLERATDKSSAPNPGEPADDIDRDALRPEYANSLPPSVEDELVSMNNIPDATNAISPNKVPEISPTRFSTTKVEDVGTSGRKTESDVASSGTRNGAKSSTDASGANRDQQFDPPKLFKTITPTEVLAAPSLLAKSLARLEADTPVHVTRRMGAWLELRSTGGRTGYIYAQDAVASATP